jgi:exonuclease VII small subunit
VTGEDLTFEQAELELRKIVEQLESGQVAVDEAYALCRERLDAAEGRVDELAKRVQPPDASA